MNLICINELFQLTVAKGRVAPPVFEFARVKSRSPRCCINWQVYRIRQEHSTKVMVFPFLECSISISLFSICSKVLFLDTTNDVVFFVTWGRAVFFFVFCFTEITHKFSTPLLLTTLWYKLSTAEFISYQNAETKIHVIIKNTCTIKTNVPNRHCIQCCKIKVALTNHRKRKKIK